MISFNEYQAETAKTWKFGSDRGYTDSLCYLTMGLTGEAGEVAEWMKKKLFHSTNIDSLEPLAYELGDVLWYLARLAEVAGVSLEEIAQMNIEKLRARHGV